MAGLYIHIPFCSRRCYYCDFFSSASNKKVEPFLRALELEMDLQRNYLSNNYLNTIYIGGGTPSTLTPENIDNLLAKVFNIYQCAPDAEITMEANPDDLTPEYLTALAKTRINRLSIGIQSFDDNLLAFMNRRHNALAASKAVNDARLAGFNNISIDLIYGIPGLTMELWRSAIEQAIALDAEHISAYHLTIEPNTVFGKRLEKGELKAIDEQVGCDQHDMLHDMLCQAGYEHYEISNFAKSGFRSRHNSSYWSGEPYLGIGPSSHSYNGTSRRWSVSSIEGYINGVNDESCYIAETLSPEDIYNEHIMTRLRTTEGIDLDRFGQLFGAHKLQELLHDATSVLERGVLVSVDGFLRIPQRHFMLSDTIICELFEEKE